MADQFTYMVEDGLKLSKRLYFGDDDASTHKPLPPMTKSSISHLPTALTLYAVINDPVVVDNPDIPSYQPHVHGRCDPPALIPLQMNQIELEIDAFLDTAFVKATGSWRLHCVMGSRSCSCLVAVPMGEQGSVLGVEATIARTTYCTEIIATDDRKIEEKECRPENGGFLQPHIFVITLPSVFGGSLLSVKVRWMQKLDFSKGVFSLNVPFNFPYYVCLTKLAKTERIKLNINSGTGEDIAGVASSHPLKETRHEAGQFCFGYESEVQTWTNRDFTFTYNVSSNGIFGGLLLQSPSVYDTDQREMFCFYLFPGNTEDKICRKAMVFAIDVSGSMAGKPLDGVKNALSAILPNLDQSDSFNIILFNGETRSFSSSLEPAVPDTVKKAIQWINTNFIAGGSTNISLPLTQALDMVSGIQKAIPVIFLVTDGSVEDEREIYDSTHGRLKGWDAPSPHIFTLGIGSYCNHYFLKLLAMTSRSKHYAAVNPDSVELQMRNLYASSSAICANITIDVFDDLDEFQMFPPCIPDLSAGTPVIVSGRYRGKIYGSVQARGLLGDWSNGIVDLKVQNVKDVPFDKVFAKQHMDVLTAQAWHLGNKGIKEVVTKMSLQTGVPSEYTRMALFKHTRGTDSDSFKKHKSGERWSPKADKEQEMVLLLGNLCLGFGSVSATAANIPPGVGEPKLPEAAEIIIKAASNCCVKLCGTLCCPCCLNCCSKLNDQFAIALAQLCSALACFSCFECCFDFCCSNNDPN